MGPNGTFSVDASESGNADALAAATAFAGIQASGLPSSGQGCVRRAFATAGSSGKMSPSRMSRPYLQLAFALAAVTIAGCASIKVSSETAPGVDLSKRVTYVWHSPAGRLPTDPRIDRDAFDRDIRAQVDESLAARGFRPAAAGAPADLMVAYRAFVKVKTDIGAVNDPVGFATGWGAYPADQGYRADSGGTYATEWEQGRLDIDLLDSDGTRLLWRGSAKTELDFSNPPKERQRRLRLAVARVIEQLPPR